ncbi:3'-5' exonuclease [Aliamphritea ceti]|uniref:3'-5' exonuclease n=1 Tax=Aliamphritea ceti TaxID=1524258 RepID=UPI0021C2FF7B|nr:3'-5' exonuclease [Aliamphritea ceti]
MSADSLVVLDFETSGMSPDYGDRAIEIGAVRLENGVVVDEFQALMNPGFRITGFIEGFTGITNQMLAKAPSCEEVMAQFADFLGDSNLLAHNASFDQRFLDHELKLIRREYAGAFCCSMLVSRRVFQAAPNHKLGTLVDYVNLPVEGQFHRALYDAQMTAGIWLAMLAKIRADYGCGTINFSTMQKLSRVSKKQVGKFLAAI